MGCCHMTLPQHPARYVLGLIKARVSTVDIQQLLKIRERLSGANRVHRI
jgi:hypothetical protein